MATPEKILAIAKYLKERTATGEKLVVVVSAMGKNTDHLLSLAHALSDTPDLREMDQLLSVGEQTTIALLAIALKELGVAARSFTAAQAKIATIGLHTKSRIESIDGQKLKDAFQTIDVAVVAGFQGVNDLGDTTTLGRGGSDTSAVALAATLETKAEIYTDVNGVYSTDPRIYKYAKKIDRISYDEMMEMSALGAKVMEMRSVELGKKYGVPIYVGQTLSSGGGTWIVAADSSMEQQVISAVALNDKILSISVVGASPRYQEVAEIFQILGRHHINVDMICRSDLEDQASLSFTSPLEEKGIFQKAAPEVSQVFPSLSFDIRDDYAKLSVVGIGMRDASGVAADLFSLFRSEHIPFHQITTSEISISFTLPKSDSTRAVERVCEKYDL